MVRRHIANVSPDVVHTHLGYADVFGGLAARALGLAAVSTIHTMDWRRNLLDPRDYAKERVMSAVRRHCASTVVTVSDAARDAYLQTGWDRPEHVLTVHNGVAARLKRGAGAAVRSELTIHPEDLVVAMITVLRPGKGHDVAVRAVERLHGRFPRLKLLIVGEGPSRREVERLAASLGDSAVLTGHREDVLALLDAADVLLHPTLVDAFPTVLLEAMAAEVPIIATAVGGIPEIVVPERTGLLVDAPPTAEKLVRALTPLLESASMRRELGKQGRRRYDAQFTSEAWAKRMRAVYESAIQSVGVPKGQSAPKFNHLP
jgi:glycosyltransferase involved in cell wall biosynthesis